MYSKTRLLSRKNLFFFRFFIRLKPFSEAAGQLLPPIGVQMQKWHRPFVSFGVKGRRDDVFAFPVYRPKLATMSANSCDPAKKSTTSLRDDLPVVS